MIKKNAKIWMWIHNGKILKAISCPDEGILTIYDEYDNILIKRAKLTPAQIKKIEIVLSTLGAKRVDGHKRPFTYL